MSILFAFLSSKRRVRRHVREKEKGRELTKRGETSREERSLLPFPTLLTVRSVLLREKFEFIAKTHQVEIKLKVLSGILNVYY